jgi:hypothetical protein
METTKEVMNKHVDLHPDPANEHFESTVDSLHRLLTELERPQNHELMRFVMAWKKLEKELDKLQLNIQQRVAEKPASKVNEFLQRLKKK